jgi:uncharacterized damage-inducible protein DinB
MASRQEIIETIQEGNALVLRTFTNLSETQAQTRIGDGGWTVKDALAHMAGRQPAYERLIRMTQPDAPAISGNVDPDAVNASLVEARRDKSVAEILAEFMTVHEWLIQQVRELPDAALTQIISLPQAQFALGDLLGRAGGGHSISHTKEVQEALSKAEAS